MDRNFVQLKMVQNKEKLRCFTSSWDGSFMLLMISNPLSCSFSFIDSQTYGIGCATTIFSEPSAPSVDTWVWLGAGDFISAASTFCFSFSAFSFSLSFLLFLAEGGGQFIMSPVSWASEEAMGCNKRLCARSQNWRMCCSSGWLCSYSWNRASSCLSPSLDCLRRTSKQISNITS